MPPTWNPSMTTGLAGIDQQHKELFRQVGQLLAAMAEGRGQAQLNEILNFLGEYAVKHFADEERAMAEYACPAASANQRAHAEFLAKFKSLREKLDRQGAGPVLVLEVQNLLNDWLVQHVRLIDTQLDACVRAERDEVTAVPRTSS